MQWTDEKITEHIKSRLDHNRFLHSVNVSKCAGELAAAYGADAELCITAGLLHDVTKNASEHEHKELFDMAGINLTAAEKSNKKLWHAMSGAVYVKYIMGIDSDEIINAVRYHTTGRAGMSLNEKVVYTADFISEERDYSDVDVMRGLAALSLDKAMEYALKFTIPDLIKKRRTVHPDSVALYNELVLNNGGFYDT